MLSMGMSLLISFLMFGELFIVELALVAYGIVAAVSTYYGKPLHSYRK